MLTKFAFNQSQWNSILFWSGYIFMFFFFPVSLLRIIKINVPELIFFSHLKFHLKQSGWLWTYLINSLVKRNLKFSEEYSGKFKRHLLHLVFTCMDFSSKFSSVQSLSRVRLFVTPWIAARQASPSITNSRSSLRLTSIESVMPSSHLLLCRPLLLLPPIPPSITVFSNESTLHIRWPKYWEFQLLPKKSQGWSPSEWTGWISLQSKGLSGVFSSTSYYPLKPSSRPWGSTAVRE